MKRCSLGTYFKNNDIKNTIAYWISNLSVWDRSKSLFRCVNFLSCLSFSSAFKSVKLSLVGMRKTLYHESFQLLSTACYTTNPLNFSPAYVGTTVWQNLLPLSSEETKEPKGSSEIWHLPIKLCDVILQKTVTLIFIAESNIIMMDYQYYFHMVGISSHNEDLLSQQGEYKNVLMCMALVSEQMKTHQKFPNSNTELWWFM